MSRKVYYMDSCKCLPTKKPKSIWTWKYKAYKCDKCWILSLGYDEWEL